MNRKNFLSKSVLAFVGIPFISKLKFVQSEESIVAPQPIKEEIFKWPKWMYNHLYKKWYECSLHITTQNGDVLELENKIDINIEGANTIFRLTLTHKDLLEFREKMSRRMAGAEVDMTKFDKKVRSISA
jgi:hypothetical protein